MKNKFEISDKLSDGTSVENHLILTFSDVPFPAIQSIEYNLDSDYIGECNIKFVGIIALNFKRKAKIDFISKDDYSKTIKSEISDIEVKSEIVNNSLFPKIDLFKDGKLLLNVINLRFNIDIMTQNSAMLYVTVIDMEK